MGFVPTASMEVKDELMDIVEKVWNKLQSLPDANPLELGAFSVIILFFGKKDIRHSCQQLTSRLFAQLIIYSIESKLHFRADFP